jgi:hypothetical protein
LSLTPWWAALVVAGLKPLENRKWTPNAKDKKLPIRFLIHASLGDRKRDLPDVLWFLEYAPLLTAEQREQGRAIVNGDVERGGIVGSASIVSIVPPHCSDRYYENTRAAREWHMREQHGWVLRDIARTPFVKWKGALGLRLASDELLSAIEKARASGA